MVEWVFIFQKLIWYSLIGIGIQFILVSLLVNEEKLFLLLGISIFLLNFALGIDYWIIPEPLFLNMNHGIRYFEFWISMFHIFSCTYIICVIWITRILAGVPQRSMAIINTIILSLFIILFFVDGLTSKTIFLYWNKAAYFSTWKYDLIFFPYVSGVFILAIYLPQLRVKTKSVLTKKYLARLSAAYLLLFIFGVLDEIIVIFHIDFIRLPYFVQYGELMVVLAGIFIFIDKIIHLQNHQRITLLKIEAANHTLSQHQALHDLGESASMITKEIQNQVSSIHIDINKISLPDEKDVSSEFDRIEVARKNIVHFTTRILRFASSSQIASKQLMDCETLLLETIAAFPNSIKERIRMGNSNKLFIPIDKPKIVEALIEIIQNAFDSGSDNILLSTKVTATQNLIEIEDDGECTQDSLSELTKPFFTTRKEQGKIGLGASIAKSIVEAHGGSLQYFKNNTPNKINRGLTAQVFLPMHTDSISIELSNTSMYA